MTLWHPFFPPLHKIIPVDASIPCILDKREPPLDEGLFRAYDMVEFLAPLHAGDFVEVRAWMTGQGATSRKMSFTCHKVIAPRSDISPSAADLLAEPVLCVKASGTCIVPRDKQRATGESK